MRGLTGLLCTTALLAPLALAPKANAQIAISIGGPPPISSYGYYGYAPYSCAPVGYYGSGYFYNGIFLGMGPWSGWGYNHGWGGHRFVAAGGGRYNGGFAGYHEMAARITANLTRPQPITISLTPPPITTNRTTLLTPPRRMLGNPTVGAESLMAGAENTTSQ